MNDRLGPSGLSELATSYLELLLRGERQAATGIVLGAADGGASLQDIYLDVLTPAQHEVGRLWMENRITVADEHYCTAATQLNMSLLYSRLFDPAREYRNRNPAVVATVEGELHELGARMVADLLELERVNTDYLGASTPTRDLKDSVTAKGAPVLSLSVTLEKNLPSAAAVISALRESPEGRGVKVVVGGAAFDEDQDAWRDVGADATALDAREAVMTVVELLDGDRA